MPILEALTKIYSNGWIHGDLKLENVRFEGEAGRLKVFLSDFGKAVRLVDHRPNQNGSLSQHITPDRTQSPQLDIYSLGVLV